MAAKGGDSGSGAGVAGIRDDNEAQVSARAVALDLDIIDARTWLREEDGDARA